MYTENYPGKRDSPDEHFGWRPAISGTTGIVAMHYVAYMAGEHKFVLDQENVLHILKDSGFRDLSARGFTPAADKQNREFEPIYAISYRQT